MFPRLTIIVSIPKSTFSSSYFLTSLELGSVLSVIPCYDIIGNVELHKMTVHLKIDGVLDSVK